MKIWITSFCMLCALMSTPCFAINFGPGPGGGRNSAEKVNIQEKNEEFLAEEEEKTSSDEKDIKKS